MTQVSFSRKRNPAHALSADSLAILGATTDAGLLAAAQDDPDNPPVSDERLDRMFVAREVRRIREKAHLSQVQFATTYRIGVGRLRDWEQGRSAPDLPALVFLRLIDNDPSAAATLVADVETAYASV